jgi:Flp pilus assembly protein TadB
MARIRKRARLRLRKKSKIKEEKKEVKKEEKKLKMTEELEEKIKRVKPKTKRQIKKEAKKLKKQFKKKEKKEKKQERLKKEAEEKIKKVKKREIEERGIKGALKKRKVIILIGFLFGAVVTLVLLLLRKGILISFISFFVASGLFFLYLIFRHKLKELARTKKIEAVFPDFLQLMATNLRAGMTIDKAILLSSRPEFAPLDKELLKTGKDMTTGKSIETALMDMAKRTRSDRIHKTILLLISGIRAGGNLATLLEETSINIREKGFVEKRAASNVLMYVIFIFIAASAGAPALFSLSSVLVETLINILSGLPAVDTSQAALPFSLSTISISINFIKYFSIVFIVVINILAALVLGLVSKGEEKEGIKFIIPMLSIAIVVFYGIRILLARFVTGLFG